MRLSLWVRLICLSSREALSHVRLKAIDESLEAAECLEKLCPRTSRMLWEKSALGRHVPNSTRPEMLTEEVEHN